MRKKVGLLLGATGALLIVLVVILLWSLGKPPERDAPRVRHRAARPAAARPPQRPAPPPRTTAPARNPLPGFSRSSTDPPPLTAPPHDDAGATSVVTRHTGAPAPVQAPGTHMAPAAIPDEITNETDPVRKAQLMRMHELAVARSRASRLRRRARLLRNTLATAKQQGSWKADKIQHVEQDLTTLGSAIKQAEKNAELAAQRAGFKAE